MTRPSLSGCKNTAVSMRGIGFGVGCLALALAAFGQSSRMQITLDGASPGRTFEGIGALSAGASSRLLIDYPEPERSQILDYLFKPDYGAALQHLKVEIGADVNSTDGAEPSHMRSPADHDTTRGYEWWLMTEARRRNPRIILDTLPWGAPGWVGAGTREHGTLYTPRMARYVVDFLRSAKLDHQLDIAYTGSWNEKPYDAVYIKELHRQLVQSAPGVRLVCCDEYVGEGQGQWSVADAMAADPELRRAIDVIGVHYPQDHGRLTTTDTAKASGKPLWSSEDQPNSGSGPILPREWAQGGRILAQVYNRNYLEGALTKTEIWSPVTAYYDILAAPNSGLMYANMPWSGHYAVQSTIWVTAHTTQFAQPGWRYLDRSCGALPGKGTYVTLRAPQGGDWSTVLETVGATVEQNVTFALAHGLADSTVHVWETNGQRSLERVSDLKPEHGTFRYSFEPDAIYTLTTTTGQGKGSAQPPPATPFPAAYREDFERTALARSPRFLADQDGAFEARPCLGRPGQCLQQVIVEKPIPWGPLPDPFTLAGDAEWSDYRVEADARFLDPGPVTLMGRIDSADVFQDAKAIWPSGYILSVFSSGRWTLCSAAYKKPTLTLAEGQARVAPDQWHHLAIQFHGNRIEAAIDGHAVASVRDGTHGRGMFAVGTGWQRAQFDDLAARRR